MGQTQSLNKLKKNLTDELKVGKDRFKKKNQFFRHVNGNLHNKIKEINNPEDSQELDGQIEEAIKQLEKITVSIEIPKHPVVNNASDNRKDLYFDILFIQDIRLKFYNLQSNDI